MRRFVAVLATVGTVLAMSGAPARAGAAFDFTCDPHRPFTVVSGAHATLTPGTYGFVLLKQKSVITLQAGTYTVCDWQAGRGSDVTTVAGTQIDVVHRFMVDNESTFGPVCDVPVHVEAQGFTRPTDISVDFSKGNEMTGTFVSQGPIALGNNNDLTGTFDAPVLRSLKNVRMHSCS